MVEQNRCPSKKTNKKTVHFQSILDVAFDVFCKQTTDKHVLTCNSQQGVHVHYTRNIRYNNMYMCYTSKVIIQVIY